MARMIAANHGAPSLVHAASDDEFIGAAGCLVTTH
jgi:hypothetical protein